MRDLRPRLAGAALVVGAGASTLLHRAAFEGTRGGPAGLAEFALGLLTFALASTGLLLLIHGSRLFRRSGRPRVGTPDDAGPVAPPTLGPTLPMSEALDTRYGVALVLAQRTIAAARSSRPAGRGAIRGRTRLR